MKVEILKSNPYVESWQGLLSGEEDGKTIFELTSEQTEHFLRNAAYYKVKAKKLFFDETYKNKVEAKKESDLKAQKILNLRLELSQLKDQEEDFLKHNIVTEELKDKINVIEARIVELGSEPYAKKETEETGV